MAVPPPPFDHASPTTVADAVTYLASHPGARLLAGGQSLMPRLAQRRERPTAVVDINGVGLDHVEVGADGDLRLGALVRHRALERSRVALRAAPLLVEAVRWVGHPAIRNRGTLGGSLAHADPAAELPTAVAALGGSVLVEGTVGVRRLTVGELVIGPFATRLEPDEVVVEVRVPVAGSGPGDGHGAAFCEWAPRHNDRATAGVALALDIERGGGPDDGPGRGRIVSVGAAACGVALPGPVVLSDLLSPLVAGAEAVSDALLRAVAAAVENAVAAVATGDDDGDTARLAGLLAARALAQAYERAGAGQAAAGQERS